MPALIELRLKRKPSDIPYDVKTDDPSADDAPVVAFPTSLIRELGRSGAWKWTWDRMMSFGSELSDERLPMWAANQLKPC